MFRHLLPHTRSTTSHESRRQIAYLIQCARPHYQLRRHFYLRPAFLVSPPREKSRFATRRNSKFVTALKFIPQTPKFSPQKLPRSHAPLLPTETATPTNTAIARHNLLGRLIVVGLNRSTRKAASTSSYAPSKNVAAESAQRLGKPKVIRIKPFRVLKKSTNHRVKC